MIKYIEVHHRDDKIYRSSPDRDFNNIYIEVHHTDNKIYRSSP